MAKCSKDTVTSSIKGNKREKKIIKNFIRPSLTDQTSSWHFLNTRPVEADNNASELHCQGVCSNAICGTLERNEKLGNM